MLLYMALAPEEKLSCAERTRIHSPIRPRSRAPRAVHCRYKEGGPAAEARFEAGVAGFEARAFRGCGIFTSEPFEVSDDADSVQMLTRSSQIGEFYVMTPPQVNPGKSAQYSCDILIFDEESDRHVRVTWAEALEACCIAQAAKNGGQAKPGVAGDTKMAFPTDKMDASADLAAWYAKAEEWAKATGDEAGAEMTDDAFKGLDKDIRIVVARPFIEHLMHNVIMTVSGRDTGATLFGPADMQLSANTQVKTIEGHCKFGGHSNPTTSLACACALTASRCLG